MEYFGIDVAKWQGTINWNKVKATGKTFAILKITKQNNTVEESFEKNYSGATSAGLNVGGYRYVYATTVEKAKAEANALVKVLNGRPMPLGVWLDMEDKTIRVCGKVMLSQIINAEAEILKAAGYNVGIYCNKDWYSNVLDSKTLASKYVFWIARYPSNDTGVYNANSSLSPKSYGDFWQYSSKGKVDGISGNVDLDVCFKNPLELMGGTPVVSVKPYSHANFIADVCTILKAQTPQEALNKTVTLSKSINKNHALITPLERYLKVLGYYSGTIEADVNKKPTFGAGLESAVVKYQKNVVKATGKNADGIITVGRATWKKLLGL